MLNDTKNKISGVFSDTAFNPDKKERIIDMYKRLNLAIDDSKFGHLGVLGKVFGVDLKSISYVFPSASGEYKGRKIEIAPSYYSSSISDIGGEFIDSPSLFFKRGTSQGAYNYMVISLAMEADIGTKMILIYPRSFWNQINTWTSFIKTSNIDKEFNAKYFISLGGQEWFLKCIDREIINSMISLDLPGIYGATFQFSRDRGTFGILPGAIETEKIEKIIEILWKIINNIEKVKAGN